MTRAAFALAITMALSLVGCQTLPDASNRDLVDTTPNAGLAREADGQSATLLSAFFGLDNTLPRTANLICRGAAGYDGMPVIFSTEIDYTTMQAGDFHVTTRSGQRGEMFCVSLLPATDAGELRTALLIGEFGDATDDPPARAEIIGHLHSIDGTLDYQGASVDVTPLEPGPTMIMAEVVSERAQDVGLGLRRTEGSRCPSEGVAQAVRVVWAGGVTLEDGSEPGETERALYRVSVASVDGAQREVAPVALADLGDGDNNHVLCLGTAYTPISVSLPAGILAHPNDDLNPASTVNVAQTP